jgi:hypothetical protein
MKHVWSVLCTKGVTDKQSNNVSLFELLEEIHLSTNVQVEEQGDMSSFGTNMANWISMFCRSDNDAPEKGNIKDEIRLPSGKTIGVRESEIDLLNHKRRRLFRTLPIPPHNKPGIYLFVTSVKDQKNNRWKKVSEIPLEVIVESNQ